MRHERRTPTLTRSLSPPSSERFTKPARSAPIRAEAADGHQEETAYPILPFPCYGSFVACIGASAGEMSQPSRVGSDRDRIFTQKSSPFR